jgi:hypothetical protein
MTELDKIRGHLTVVILNNYGGIEKTCGYPYIYIEDNIIKIDCAIDLIDRLGKTTYPERMITFDMENEIPKEYLPNLYYTFDKGFGSNFAYNYASYSLFKKGGLEYLNNLKTRITKIKNELII